MTTADTTWTHKRARIARLSQSLPPSDPLLVELRTELKTQRTAEYLQQMLATVPPLSAEQRHTLAALLMGGES